SVGIRVVKNGSVGFATVNGTDRLETACEDALAMAAASPPDPGTGLRDPEGDDAPPPWVPPVDPAIAELDVEAVVEIAAELLARVRAIDPRVRVDSGGVGAAISARAIATS